MLREFTRFVQSIFPAIDPGNARAFLKAQFEYAPVWPDLFATRLPPKICQGDILAPITFIVQASDGTYGEWTGPGMLLSHSCDVDEGDYVCFAPCRRFEEYRTVSFVGALLRNTIFRLFYVQGVPTIGDTVVDFDVTQTTRRALIVQGVETDSIRRVSSFTDYGYWLLVAKMTVHSLRPPAPDEVREVSRPGLATRAAAAYKELVALAGYLVRGRG